MKLASIKAQIKLPWVVSSFCHPHDDETTMKAVHACVMAWAAAGQHLVPEALQSAGGGEAGVQEQRPCALLQLSITCNVVCSLLPRGPCTADKTKPWKFCCGTAHCH